VKKIFYSSYLGFKLLLSLEAFKKKTELDPLQYQPVRKEIFLLFNLSFFVIQMKIFLNV